MSQIYLIDDGQEKINVQGRLFPETTADCISIPPSVKSEARVCMIKEQDDWE